MSDEPQRPSEEQGSTEASRPNVKPPATVEDEPKEETPEEVITEPVDKAEEYLNNWKRERADFLNYKKDEAKRIEEFARFANEDVILETIEIVDDLELAVQEYKDIGLESIIKKFKDLFRKYGIEEIKVSGEKFNPELHEAVETEKEGAKLIQVRAGYTMHGKVIRPARVRITK